MSWHALVEHYLREKRSSEGTLYNCVESAAIISKLNGAIYASTPNFSLSQYSVTIPNDELGTSTPLRVNETKILLHSIKNGGTSLDEGGLRFNSEKFYLVHYDLDTRSMYLRKSQGGACISWTNVVVIYASWSENEQTSGYLGRSQSAALCNERVESLSNVLFFSNY